MWTKKTNRKRTTQREVGKSDTREKNIRIENFYLLKLKRQKIRHVKTLITTQLR